MEKSYDAWRQLGLEFPSTQTQKGSDMYRDRSRCVHFNRFIIGPNKFAPDSNDSAGASFQRRLRVRILISFHVISYHSAEDGGDGIQVGVGGQDKCLVPQHSRQAEEDRLQHGPVQLLCR